MNITIRQETESDFDAVYNVVKEAFANAEHTSGDEQDLVVRLRKSEAFIPELSLVAVDDENKVVGHILFTKTKIGDYECLGLAPIAVLPECQKEGIGGKLIVAGHDVAKKLGYGSSFLVGYPDYYPRFGYVEASRWNVTQNFGAPSECFMGIEFFDGALDGVSGLFEYAKEFFVS